MVLETTNSVGDTKDIVFLTNVGFQTLDQRERLFQKLLNDHTPLVTAVKSACLDFEVQKLAKKLHQNKRPRTNRTQSRY
jgi:hypothetical protein